jgi:hypothetical protein
MAELQGEIVSNKAEIVPAASAVETVQGDFGRFLVRVKEYDAAGQPDNFALAITTDHPVWGEHLMNACVLKQAEQWRQTPLMVVAWASRYAKENGLDIFAGDVYMVQGRVSTSNKAKIKKALASGLIKGIETTITKLSDPPPQGCTCVPNDLECTATITVAGWEKPIIRKARLSRWFKRSNPNWVSNPEHMLELNTVAHACEFVAPGGTEADEVPYTPQWDLEDQLRASVTQTIPKSLGASHTYSIPPTGISPLSVSGITQVTTGGKKP